MVSLIAASLAVHGPTFSVLTLKLKPREIAVIKRDSSGVNRILIWNYEYVASVPKG